MGVSETECVFVHWTVYVSQGQEFIINHISSVLYIILLEPVWNCYYFHSSCWNFEKKYIISLYNWPVVIYPILFCIFLRKFVLRGDLFVGRFISQCTVHHFPPNIIVFLRPYILLSGVYSLWWQLKKNHQKKKYKIKTEGKKRCTFSLEAACV